MSPSCWCWTNPLWAWTPRRRISSSSCWRICAQKGGAVFFSSHVLEVVEKLCNKIAIIKKGKIIVSGLTEDILKDESLEDLFLELTDNE